MAQRRIRARLEVFLVLVLFGCGRILPLMAQDGALLPISGVVLAEDTDKPIANALVLISSPARDMRSVRAPSTGLFATQTDANGRFNVQAPKNEKISLNAFAPGYEEAAGMWMSGHWTLHNVPFPASRGQEFTIKLQPASYVAGIIVDESGRPISGVAVEATITDERSTAYVAFDITEADGRFQIFDFPPKPEAVNGNTNAHGQLTFRNSAKLTSVIKNVYALSETGRTNIQVTLSSGHEIKGIVTSADGQPLPQIIVEAIPADENAAQRTSMIDAEGRFVIRNLPDGSVNIHAHSLAFDQQARKTFQLAGADAEANLPMEPVVLKTPPKPVSLLGMKLANVTPELQAVYDLDSSTGVLILDPGPNHLRLGIGQLSQGERFWIVGNRQIKNLREMVTELLRIDAITPPGDPNEGSHGSIRVVYTYRNGAGTMTARLKLTDADIAELKSVRLIDTP